MRLMRLSAAALVLVLAAAASPAAALADAGDVEIRVLSNRADLVSGGDALVELVVPESARADELVVRRGDTDISKIFARRSSGRIVGLVTGLADGPNELTATLPSGQGARLTIRNHPIGGPIFSGPPVEPWVCETERADLGPPQDEQCNAPSNRRFQYISTSGGPFRPYNPAAPAPDVAKVTTDEGISVPYIVRRERGTINRSIYEFVVLFDPSVPWEPWAPQAAWNEKLYYHFDGGAAPQRRQGTVGDEVMIDLALRRGFAVAYATLNRFGMNTNSVTSAEAVVMVKEKIIETLGPIRYTIGEGGSGGSIQQHLITEGYPGLLDGVQPGASFQDIVTTNTTAQDCSLLVRYFTQTSPHLWTDTADQAAVFGNDNAAQPGNCRTVVALWLDKLLMDPVYGFACHNSNGVAPGTPQPWAYNPATNPAGARCTLQDHQVALYGTRADDGFANRPYDNVGVQYGLDALNEGAISVEQFLDANEKVGGRDIDGAWQPSRSSADATALAVAYRTGQVNSGRGVASTPTIDIRNCTNNELHSCFHTYVMRQRVNKQGSSGGHVIFLQESQALSLPVLDRWVSAIKADPSADPLPIKVERHRPADAVDSCWLDGAKVTETAVCAEANPYVADPRIAAGGPFTDDVLKCELQRPSRSDYRATFSSAQWDRLLQIFSTGVCDWTKPGVGHEESIPWLTFGDARSQAIFGGVPLGPAPTSEPFDRPAGAGAATPGLGSGTLPATGPASEGSRALTLLAIGLALAGARRRVSSRQRRRGRGSPTVRRERSRPCGS